MSTAPNSFDTGREVAQRIQEGFSERPALVLAYFTVNHDQNALLRGLHEVLGGDVPVIGCSAQGVIGLGAVREEGYAAGALALGGPGVTITHACVEEIARDAFGKGRELGLALKRGQPGVPSAVVLHYDALCEVDPDKFLAGLFSVVECPIVGGAAGHSFNYQSLQATYVYAGERVLSGAAVAFAISGAGVEIGDSLGCSPVGVEMTVTRAEANKIYELDGRPAADVWTEICGPVTPHANQSAALAIGVPITSGARAGGYMVRAAYVVDHETGSVWLGPAIPTGTKIMLHHRTVEDVLDGSRVMGEELSLRLKGRRARAVLTFECGARTSPFLGNEATLKENLALQKQLDADAWLGMMPWGELFPVGGRPAFHNYTFPLVVFTD